MIPIKLTIEGLYSYQERQTIDFSNLIDAGLFGIFGAVGSGKSSILEAITFALFGETERLNSRDKRAYNMMNLKSNRSYIEFDFVNYENKLFRATRDFKRNSKRFDEVKSPTVVFFEMKNDEWIPLDHSNAEQIIGLSYSNFKRTIIIPQGQFKEFIELGASERTKMMKEIFNLHRFDLQDKVALLAKKNQSDLDQLQGKLSGFEEVSVEAIQQLQDENIEQTKAQELIQQNYQSIFDQFQRLKTLKSDFEQLKQKKIEFEKLEIQKASKDEKRNKLELYEQTFAVFHQLFIDQEKVNSSIEIKSNELNQQQKQLVLLDNQFTEINKKLTLLQPDFDLLAQKKIEENDLQFIAEILLFQQEIILLKERTKKGIEKVEEVKTAQKEQENAIKSVEKEIEELSKNRFDAQVLMAIDNWFVQQKNNENAILKQQTKKVDLEKQFAMIESNLNELKVNADNYKESFELRKNTLEQQRKEVENQKNNLDVQVKLSHYSHNLHDGKPCPLCGALEHPNVIELQDVSSELLEIQQQLKSIEEESKLLQENFVKVQGIVNQKLFIQQQIETESTLLLELKNNLESHQKQFIWKEFAANNLTQFEQKKKEVLENEEQIKIKSTWIAEQRKVLENGRIQLDKYSEALVQFQLKENQKSTQIEQNKRNLKRLNCADFENYSEKSIQDLLENLKNANQKIEENYTSFTKELAELNPILSAQKTTIELTQKQLNEFKNEAENLIKQIDIKLNESSFSDKNQLHEILNLKLNIVEERKQLDDFRLQYELAKNTIIELENKLSEVSFDETLFQEKEKQLNEITSQLKEANELVTKIRTEIERLQKEYEAKKELLKQMEQLQKRATNIQVLRNMFSAAGFVQYVSSIYLKQLCENANVRFHRMTRNQLSLQLNENNDFEIIDYLNEGRSRSVKTLSGGQSFQVSLSLALALAESVQANSMAERNFFFIDEGFGTQDAEAVNIVFETLNHLHKENRIVGIISHVEELKERIPVALTIEKDEEKGSQIYLA